MFLRGDDEAIDVVKQPGGEGFTPGVGDIVGVVGEVPHHFVAAIHANRGKVIVQAGQPPSRVGVEPVA